MRHRLHLQTWLDFFDARPEAMRKAANAINAMAGEEVCVEAFRRYVTAKGWEADRIELAVKRAGASGKRLDAWLRVSEGSGSETLFQVEVKNWSAHSLGCLWSTRLSFEERCIDRWGGEWCDRTGLRKEQTRKVLTKMEPPPSCQGLPHRALLIYWYPVAPSLESDPLFVVRVPQPGDFNLLYVFSVSRYFRTLLQQGVHTLDLALPDFDRRLSALNRLISVQSE